MLTCRTHHEIGFPLWVTFPFDPATPDAQPESLARVVRCKPAAAGSVPSEEIALHFEGIPGPSPAIREPASNGTHRNGTMRTVSVPVRVRPRHIPWHEEAMTVEVSFDRIRFLSNREYELGETLLVTLLNADAKPWQGSGEIPATIEKVEKMPQSSSLIITLKRAT